MGWADDIARQRKALGISDDTKPLTKHRQPWKRFSEKERKLILTAYLSGWNLRALARRLDRNYKSLQRKAIQELELLERD